jgi:type I restriction enzyme, S subunit
MKKRSSGIKTLDIVLDNFIPKEEQPYNLPQNWSWVRLGQLVEMERGITFPASAKKDSFSENLIACARTANIQNELVLDDLIYVDKEFLKGNEAKLIRSGDILMSTANSYTLVGKVVLVEELDQELAFGGFLLCIRPKKAVVKFIYYYLRYLFLSGQIQRLSSQTTNIANLNGKKLENLPIPLPNEEEQQRIVKRLESLLGKVNSVRTLALDASETCFSTQSTILVKAFIGELTQSWRENNEVMYEEVSSKLLNEIHLTNSDETRKKGRGKIAASRGLELALGDIPNGWINVPLGLVAPLQVGYAFKSAWFSKKGTRLLRGINIVPGGTRWDDTVYLPEDRVSEFEKYLLAEADVVIAMDRPIISSGIKVAILESSDLPALLLQRVGRFNCSKFIRKKYLYYFLQSKLFTGYISGQATGTQLPHISATDISSVQIPLPSITEQDIIIDKLEKQLGNLSLAKENAESCIIQLDELIKGILYRSFSGNL